MSTLSRKRIAVNVFVTYLRTMLMVALGIFTGRWALMALGETDYGLVSLVASLDIFIVYFNYILSASISRYYAYSLGISENNLETRITECQWWFNTSLAIHLFLPIIIICISYPVMVYAIRYWLIIPPERIFACVFGYTMANINIFFGFLVVPFQAMMIAKQEIAEFTLYNLVPSFLRIIFLGFIVSHPGDWLWTYFWVLPSISSFFSLFIIWRVLNKYRECKINFSFMKSLERYKKIFLFSFWLLVGGMGDLCCRQGIVILVNKFFGPNLNASYGIAGTVSGQANQLASALGGAFTPAITTAYGGNDQKMVQQLAYSACKFSTILVLIFSVPLFLELPEVLHLWLINPPESCVGLCRCILICIIFDKLCMGHSQILRATGKIKANQIVNGVAFFLATPLAFVGVKLGWGICSVGYALILVNFMIMVSTIWLARIRGGLSLNYWLKHIFLPLLIICFIATLFGIGGIKCIDQSFFRIIFTTLICNSVILIMGWKLLLVQNEKEIIKEKARNLFHKFLRRA